jgi:hypothetical protein
VVSPKELPREKEARLAVCARLSCEPRSTGLRVAKGHGSTSRGAEQGQSRVERHGHERATEFEADSNDPYKSDKCNTKLRDGSAPVPYLVLSLVSDLQ